ncbi:unnamed protein product [Rotaria sp. Silwood2]|nr:unnamed protein product [Rotaria sp. Silwood2]CAF3480058.1 unnamed protein product [Rotaria sp. Silwood2]CAF4491464.1 unnamed protein product [Rotaria sp. Silwood2]CAF4531381.1 unnamed protein product [Rotaria sp. Silwood2]CAF4606909.1 unnamed protein product [Rotaria sp. Silwood2]
MGSTLNAQTNIYLPKNLASLTTDFETEYFYFNYATNTLNYKLLTKNLYRPYLKQVYPSIINEYELTDDMLSVLKCYTDSKTNECFMKTNLNLLSANLDDIDWTYVNKLRSLIRGLVQSNIKHFYYRGLTLSDTEIQYYLDNKNQYYYTNSFTSFTIDRLLIYSGNSILILRTDTCNDKAKINLANIWKWSTFTDEKEALLSIGTKLKILSVHYFGCKWEIEVELAEDDIEQDENITYF